MSELTAPPVLSTPAENLFDQVDPFPQDILNLPRRSDDELRDVYEVERTAKEVRQGKRKCVGLQFPDSMLGDAPRVADLLKKEFERGTSETSQETTNGEASKENATKETDEPYNPRIYILADTSYSACCVDEVAAEHADADIVVHYGRSCLSPTSRLPVIYVFTQHTLDEDKVVEAINKEYGTESDEHDKVILMADVTYQDHVAPIAKKLSPDWLLSTDVVHNPLGSIPNRTLVNGSGEKVDDATIDLQNYSIFHIGQPPTSLLLALASRVKSFVIYSADSESDNSTLKPSTMGLLGRRYAKVLNMATAGVIGILVNTLSVSNYLGAVDNIRKRIADAGKKSYVVVVGKLNAVKLANFAEVDGWVVVGCWESSLVEDDAGFYQPVVTPFEMEMALMSDDERVWGLKWWGGLEGLSPLEETEENGVTENGENVQNGNGDTESGEDEEESEPPQFDLRTGRLVTTSRPMRPMRKTGRKISTNGTNSIEPGNSTSNGSGKGNSNGSSLTLRPKAELATIKGVVSPGAEFLRSQRTWQGLGTDFDPDEEASTLIEEGRGGIARGYAVGNEHRT